MFYVKFVRAVSIAKKVLRREDHTIFKVLIASIMFVAGLNQYTFKIQQNLKTYRQQLL